MSYKYMLLDSRGAPVAQGVSEDGPEKNVWQLRIAHGDIKRVLGTQGKDFTRAALSVADSSLCGGVC